MEQGLPPGDGPAGRICLGRITGAHGLRGELSVRSFTAEPDDVCAYGPLTVEPGGRQLRLRVVGHRKLELIVRADGIADRNAAEALRGADLYVRREALPPPADDEYYHADLIGMAAVISESALEAAAAADSARLGRVTAVHDFGAGPMLEIASETGASLLVPFTRAAVPQVDLAAGLLRIAPLPGLLAPEADAAQPPEPSPDTPSPPAAGGA